jgi:Tfp pilus assembly protein PilF
VTRSSRRGLALLAFLLAAVSPLGGLAQDPRRIDVIPSKSATAAATQGDRWAIVVGLDRYKNSEVPPLHGAIADAKAIASALVRYADFNPDHVFLLASDATVKPTASAILDKFVELKKQVRHGDLVLFYFAGHGVEVDGRRYLLTYEADVGSSGSLRTTTLQVSDLMQEVEGLPLSDRIIMVDACRDDPINAGQRQPNLATSTMEAAFTLQASGEAGVRATFLSCKRGQSAYEWGEKGRGFFSYFIEKGLSGEAAAYGKVTVTSLAGYLNENVPQAVRQQRGKDQTPFADLKGEALTLVRGEKMAVNPEAERAPAPPETRTVYGLVKDSNGLALGGVDVRLNWVAGAPRGASAAGAAPNELRAVTDEDGFFKAEVPARATVEVAAGGSGAYGANRVQVSPQEGGKKVSLFLPTAALVAMVPERSPVGSAPPAPPEVPQTSTAAPATETPVEPPPGTPAQPPVEAPAATPVEPPVESPIGAPVETPIVKPAETPPATPEIPKPPSPALQAQELAKVAERSFLVEEFDQAEEAARGALDLDPQNALAQAIVANCLAVYGVNRSDTAKLAASRAMASDILTGNPRVALAHNALGLALYGSGDIEGARKEFSAARELDPELSVANANLGQTYYTLKKLKDSEKAYRAAIKARPDAAVPYNGLAQVLLAQNRAGDAVKASREAISRYELRDVYLGSFYVNLAVALFQDRKREEALESIARAKALGVAANPAYEIIEKAPVSK